MSGMSRRLAGDLEYYQFPELAEAGLVHGVFTRQGGCSPAPFESLNVSFGVGDAPGRVRQNRQTLKAALGVATLVSARQVHGDGILVLERIPEADREFAGFDALVTALPVALMIQQADCQAVLVYDPQKQVLGLAHAGWRGSVAGIVGKTVRAMVEVFGGDPAGMLAAISPSLGPCCGEFIDFRRELPAWMHDFQVRPNYFDFPAITSRQLTEAGLRPERVHRSGVCTRCDPAYFSYRRSGVTGRFATVAALSSRGLSC